MVELKETTGLDKVK